MNRIQLEVNFDRFNFRISNCKMAISLIWFDFLSAWERHHIALNLSLYQVRSFVGTRRLSSMPKFFRYICLLFGFHSCLTCQWIGRDRIKVLKCISFSFFFQIFLSKSPFIKKCLYKLNFCDLSLYLIIILKYICCQWNEGEILS